MLCGRTEEALSSVERAIALRPSNSHAWAVKAKLLAETNPEQSMRCARKALKLHNCPASVWETLGKLWLQRNDKRQAAACLQKFLDLADPATLWESNLPERLKAARELLDGLQ